MKKALSLILLIAMIMSSVPVYADTETDENGLIFELNEDGKSYTLINGKDYIGTSLTIP